MLRKSRLIQILQFFTRSWCLEIAIASPIKRAFRTNRATKSRSDYEFIRAHEISYPIVKKVMMNSPRNDHFEENLWATKLELG